MLQPDFFVVLLPVFPVVLAAPQVQDELPQTPYDVRRNYVFQFTGHVVGDVRLQLEDMLEKFLNDNVPVGDIPPDVHPRFGQVDEAVGLIVHIAHAFQRLQRAGDGGAGHARRLRDGTGAGRAFPDFLMEDDF